MMMRYACFLSTVLFLLILNHPFAQNLVLHWEKAFADMGTGNAIGAQTDSLFFCLTKDNLIKFNLDGDIVSSSPTPFPASDFVPANDSEFVLTGTDTAGAGQFAKINEQGSIRWDSSVTFPLYYIINDHDNGFLCAGGARLIHLDSAGDETWRKEYPPSTFEGASISNIKKTRTGNGYIFCGGNSIVKIDGGGTVTGSGNYGNDLDIRVHVGAQQVTVYAVDVQPSGIILALWKNRKRTYSSTRGEYIEDKMAIVSVNQSFVAWTLHSFTNSAFSNGAKYLGKEIMAIDTADYLMLARKQASGSLRPVIRIYSSSGRAFYMPESTVYYGAIPYRAAPIDTNCFVICGSKGADLWVAKIGPESKKPPSISKGRTYSVSSSLRILVNAHSFWYTLPFQGKFIVKVYDIQGRLISGTDITLLHGRTHLLDLRREHLPSGVYGVRFVCEKKVYSRKIVVTN